MNDDDPRLNSPFDSAFRAAHQALRALAPPDTVTVGDDGESLSDVVEDLEYLVRLAGDTAAVELGPSIRWVSTRPIGDLSAPVTLQNRPRRILAGRPRWRLPHRPVGNLCTCSGRSSVQA